ncbi:isochorismatase family protein [uncultured Intestinimonas sp.]|uniref:isochorismatase family protein n=2 Tax=Intestinimonas TaxID=1392389 RepID=UPI0029425F2E|nr:isochorismatase family protein [uncultured Intestinimonas sp.]
MRMNQADLLTRFHLDAEDAVLLIIDVQTKLMAAMEETPRVFRNTGILLTAAKALDIPVVVTEQYPKGLGPTAPEVAGLLPPEVRMLEKSSFDAARDGLLPVLEGLGRRSVMVCGTETHVCVYQTVRSLLEQDYRVFPIGDAICSRTPWNYQSGLALMDRMGACVLTAEGAAFDLLKVSGTPAFKTVSAALK